MNDITIEGPESLVASDVKHIYTIGATTGLDWNFIKCKQINKSSVLTSEPIGQFRYCTTNNAIILGALFVPGPAMDLALGKKLDDLERASDRLQLIPAHDALVLLRASCSAPKLMHVMRSLPCAGHTLLSDIGNSLHLTLSIITSVTAQTNNGDMLAFPLKLEV